MISTDQEYNNKMATALGTVGTVFWCIQLVPQIYTNFRRRDTTGLPPMMMFLWAVSGVLFGMYFVPQAPSLPLVIQPQIFTAFCLITFGQCLYFPPARKSLARTMLYTLGLAALGGGIELAFALPFKNSHYFAVVHNRSPHTWPLILVGVLAALALLGGLIQPYFGIFRRKGQVLGINFFFLMIDSTGAIFSFASLLFPQTNDDGSAVPRDYLGMILYLFVPLLEGGIVLSHCYWYFTIGRRLRAEQSSSKIPDPEKLDSLTTQQTDDTLAHNNLESLQDHRESEK
ncbi:PQ loop repeat-domain-containing protein [Lipomyces oligophaga]|uniref:PQ loop repeat-domain-containing protein n=1 Tax=Lipomyces oligophaga TaxID=45792 RepID=UPI0034CE04C6